MKADKRTGGAFRAVIPNVRGEKLMDGAVVHADQSGDKAMYGDDVERHEILGGKMTVPASARALLHEIRGYTT
ncbi:MAG: YSC84-related protein [Candidatus Acidiferrum sp.]